MMEAVHARELSRCLISNRYFPERESKPERLGWRTGAGVTDGESDDTAARKTTMALLDPDLNKTTVQADTEGNQAQNRH